MEKKLYTFHVTCDNDKSLKLPYLSLGDGDLAEGLVGMPWSPEGYKCGKLPTPS